MNQDSKVLTIRCFEECTYHVEWPDFFLSANPKTSLKLLKWLIWLNWKEGNRETIDYISEHLPELQSTCIRYMVDRLDENRKRMEMALCSCIRPEDRYEVKKTHMSIARAIRKAPENAKRITDWWEGATNGKQ